MCIIKLREAINSKDILGSNTILDQEFATPTQNQKSTASICEKPWALPRANVKVNTVASSQKSTVVEMI